MFGANGLPKRLRRYNIRSASPRSPEQVWTLRYTPGEIPSAGSDDEERTPQRQQRESLDCHSCCPDCSCYDRRTGCCADCCSTRRHARPEVPAPFSPSRKHESRENSFSQTPCVAMLKMRDPTLQPLRDFADAQLPCRIRDLHAPQTPPRPA